MKIEGKGFWKMKNMIIGTAGHIDHGKTSLVKALTGRNTDRWEEEQRRGITIDLGFTYFDLKSGDRVGIIDVPGHEKFIDNMVAGVVGMDLVILVIAADEGIMPQTREHMDILGELGVTNSIVVLNKCDLVDEEWLELVEEEVKEELKGTFLENAPILKVSAHTGEGIEELKEKIEEYSQKEEVQKETGSVPRLPIDRVFTISGFGTVITGTLLSGRIRKEDVLMIYPEGKECRIRSIQVHGRDVEECFAGQRVAINLPNIKKNEIKRGSMIAPKDNMKNTMMLDVKLNVLPASKHILYNNSRLHLYIGTKQVLCRAVLLDKEEVWPAESSYVQFRLEEEIAVSRGDRFLVRFYSPVDTIGGGVILDANPTKKKRFQQEVIEDLKRKESGSAGDIIEMQIKSQKDTMVSLTELARRTSMSPAEISKEVEALKEDGAVLSFSTEKDSYLMHHTKHEVCTQKIVTALKEYHSCHPYRFGINKAQIHTTYMKDVARNVFDLYVELLEEEGLIGRRNEYIRTAAFEVSKDETYRTVEGKAEETFKKARFEFVKLSEVSFDSIGAGELEDIIATLMEEGVLVKVADDTFTLTSLMDEAKGYVLEKLAEENLITIAELRDLLGTNRKNAKQVMEYMDSIKVTKKVGGESERVGF